MIYQGFLWGKNLSRILYLLAGHSFFFLFLLLLLFDIGLLSEMGVMSINSEKKLNVMCGSISSSNDTDFMKIRELTCMVF